MKPSDKVVMNHFKNGVYNIIFLTCITSISFFVQVRTCSLFVGELNGLVPRLPKITGYIQLINFCRSFLQCIPEWNQRTLHLGCSTSTNSAVLVIQGL